MKHERFITWCLSTPWALMPERMSAYAAVLARSVTSETVVRAIEAGAAAGDERSAGPRSRGNSGRSGAIAVIPVHGPIVQRASQIGMCESGTSCDMIGAQMADAQADDTVAQILLDIDSPGGSVYGVQELAAQITGSKKPVVAVANSLAASAAYWLGCAAGEFYVTPGGEVGSIGVWMAHQDWSKALAETGVDTTLISAGKFKVEGNPYQPLDADARAFMQSRVDDYYSAFTKGVAKGRKVPIDAARNGMGQGRVLGADDALSEKMIDGIATIDQVVANMQKNIRAAKAPASRLAAAQRELQIVG
ncbi:S49 family peptidase [Paraburkholderia tuberum]|uniref:Signal peptide peptidase SppA n=1 Tax=Paraburkholderia tuberum TaxID=157910 RepID=A0A1H1JB69_9BURK|nr:S49 family peptidase [Paraburkholderia tuberum]SDR47143.1 signal peptide peptidase SppA [Paraburkholderia tuberum]